MSFFPKEDYYYDEKLDKFFGEELREKQLDTSSFLGWSGCCFVLDDYRNWLMKVLKQEGFKSFEEAYQKYRFLDWWRSEPDPMSIRLRKDIIDKAISKNPELESDIQYSEKFSLYFFSANITLNIP